ncbi:hypothetical protein [Burkholderia sp. Ac-20365]|uniref:hypothetical protein n=1 Tax=Burkholderia sp. Ac-20365 TaxID=2703897 RepID=UPI00197B8CF5|nr:hypothetical protein [Burkholderia sp. Ac-20365]MBN3761612.1 hypothetical protein [Burkholderia sp. Ac-20365]
MTRPLRTRAELLTYLVISQILQKSTTAEWLSDEQVVLAARRWHRVKGGRDDWLERIKISGRARAVAENLAAFVPLTLTCRGAVELFAVIPRLDFREPYVRTVYRYCVDYIVDMQTTI